MQFTVSYPYRIGDLVHNPGYEDLFILDDEFRPAENTDSRPETVLLSVKTNAGRFLGFGQTL